MMNFLYKPKRPSFGRDLTFSLYFMLKGALFEHDECELRFETKTFTILFLFLRTNTKYWIGICDFDFIMLSSCFLASSDVQLKCEFRRVVHFVTDNCSDQAVHSFMRFPRSLYRDVQRFGWNSVRLNAEVCYRREGAEATSKGKDPVFILLLDAICVRCCCVFFVCFVCFRSRSQIVPYRGEWVKQRTVHTRNWNNCYRTAKSSILVNLLYLLTTRVWL
jgi:hypothetical protein